MNGKVQNEFLLKIGGLLNRPNWKMTLWSGHFTLLVMHLCANAVLSMCLITGLREASAGGQHVCLHVY